MAIDTWRFLRSSAATTAEIVAVRVETGSSRDSEGFSRTTYTHWPTVRFVDATEAEIVAETSQPASGFTPQPGQRIPVRYVVDDPRWVRPAFSWWTLWSGPILFTGIGATIIAGMTFSFRFFDRLDRRSGPVSKRASP